MKTSLLFIFLSLLNSFTQGQCADRVQLALNWKPEPEFGGFYAAQEQGIFKKYGFEVEILPGGSGQPILQMVSAGKTEFGISSADEVAIARSKGMDIVALFAVYQTYPQGIMVHESAGIQNLEQLFKSNFTVALQNGLPYTAFLEKTYGFKKVKIVPYTGGIGQFLHNKKFAQQCFITSEPITARRSNAHPKTFLISESGYNPYTTVVITRGSSARKNRELTRRFVKAIREGWQHYQRLPDVTNAYMFGLNNSLSLEDYRESAKTQHPLIETKEAQGDRIGTMSLGRWKDLIAQLLQIGAITKAPVAEECFIEF